MNYSFFYFLIVVGVFLDYEVIYLTPDHDLHPVYISVVEIDHEEGEKNAEFKIKIFTNDLEDAIKNATDSRIRLLNNKSCIKHNKLIMQYFKDHFKLKINGNSISFALEKCEIFNDSIWFYFHSETPVMWNKMQITADYLMELFPDQSNIIKISHGEHKVYQRLVKGNPSRIINFSD